MRFVGQINREGNDIIIRPPYPIDLKDGKYSVEITDYKKGRSLNQNAYLWKLINEISKKENGDYTESQNIYIMMLRMAKAKHTDLIIQKEALEDFRKLYRDIDVLKTSDDMVVIRAYQGSSQMDTKEMSELIDVAIKYAQEVGIDTRYYLEVFNG